MVIKNQQCYVVGFPSSFWHEDIVLKTGLFEEVSVDIPQEVVQSMSDAGINENIFQNGLLWCMYYIINKHSANKARCGGSQCHKDNIVRPCDKSLRVKYNTGERYPFDKLQVWQFFELPLEKYNSACSSASTFSKNNPRRVFSVTTYSGNFETVVKVTRVR